MADLKEETVFLPETKKEMILGAGQVEPFFESCGFVSPIGRVKSSHKAFAERKSPDNSRLRWIIVSHHCRSTLASSAAGSKPLPVYVRLLPSSEPCFVAAWTEAVWQWSRMQILCSRLVPELWHDATQGWRPFSWLWSFESIIQAVWQSARNINFLKEWNKSKGLVQVVRIPHFKRSAVAWQCLSISIL